MKMKRQVLAVSIVSIIVILVVIFRAPPIILNGSVNFYPPSARQALLNEYQQLNLDVLRLQASVDKLQKRLRDEPRPPEVDDSILQANAGAPVNAQRPADYRDKHDDETIFVSIASFRDAECPNTVVDMYERAKRPMRLFMGIIEQNEPADPPCFPPVYMRCNSSQFCPSDNIRIRRVLPKQAKGPTFGRYIAMLMYRGEKYFMMIDSHNRFIKNWESKLIAMYQLIPVHSKGVFSHYPAGWANDTKSLENLPTVYVMCNGHFLESGYLRLDGQTMRRPSKVRLQPFAAAGFLFADAALVQEVPFDPYLDYIFDGEEILYSVRMWTHGWDMYSPTENVLYHYYMRKGAPRVWSVPQNRWGEHQAVSVKRVQYILNATYKNTTTPLVRESTPDHWENPRIFKELDKYGLGKARKLEDYWKFAKVDPIKRTAGTKFCDMVR